MTVNAATEGTLFPFFVAAPSWDSNLGSGGYPRRPNGRPMASPLPPGVGADSSESQTHRSGPAASLQTRLFRHQVRCHTMWGPEFFGSALKGIERQPMRRPPGLAVIGMCRPKDSTEPSGAPTGNLFNVCLE